LGCPQLGHPPEITNAPIAPLLKWGFLFALCLLLVALYQVPALYTLSLLHYTNSMVIYLYGTDFYRRQKKLRSLLDKYKAKHQSIDIKFFDLEDESEVWQEVVDFLDQPSMFVPTKLAVVKNLTHAKSAGWIKGLKKHLKSENVYVVGSGRKEPPASFSFLRKAPALSQRFEELTESEVKKELNRLSVKFGLKFGGRAKSFLANYIMAQPENRSGIMLNEVSKLVLAGFKKEINENDLSLLIDPQLGGSLFWEVKAMVNASTASDKLVKLERSLMSANAADHVFNMAAAVAWGRASFRLAYYDILKKSGRLDYEEALVDFCLR